jgi:hypothetical protein
MSRIHNTDLKIPSGYFGEFQTTLNTKSGHLCCYWQAIFQTEVQLFLIIRRSICNFWISWVKSEGGQCLTRRILNKKKVHTLLINLEHVFVGSWQTAEKNHPLTQQPASLTVWLWRTNRHTFCILLEFMTNRWTKDKLCVVYKVIFSWGLYLFQ